MHTLRTTEYLWDVLNWDTSVEGELLVRSVETTTPRDVLGLPLRTTVTTNVGDTSDTVPTYEHRTSGVWQIGLVRSSTVTSSAIVRNEAGVNVTQSATVRTERTYDALARVSTETIQPGDTSQGRIAIYGYSPRGQVESIEARTFDGTAPRRSTFAYAAAGGAEVTSTTNAEGHTISRTVHPGLGVTLREVDAGGRAIARDYDFLGRPRAIRREDGSSETVTYGRGGGRTPLLLTVQDSSGRIATQSVDVLGRAVLERIAVPDGKETSQQRIYDFYGRLTHEEVPQFTGQPRLGWARFQYDGLDRPTRMIRPDGRFTGFVYTSDSTTMHAPGSPPRTTRFDALGRTIEATEQVRGATEVVTYDYGAFGRLVRIDDAHGRLAASTRDALGRITTQWTLEGGTSTMAYNGFGDLVSISNPARGVTSHTFDRLGRQTGATNSRDGSSTFVYDTAPNGIGQLAYAQRDDGTRIGYQYDSVGRQSREEWRIANEAFHYDIHYDSIGRVSELEYPSDGVSPRFAVEYTYGPRGEVRRIADADSGATYWRYVASDAAGRLTETELGEGIHTTNTFDPLAERLERTRTDIRGGLIQAGTVVQDLSYQWETNDLLRTRTDNLANRSDEYTYDDAERLTNWRVTVTAPDATSVVDHAYDYDAIGNLTSLDGVEQHYGEAFAQGNAHAVSSVSLDASYRYDAAGRRLAGGGRTVTYNQFDLPTLIVTPERTVTYAYGPYGERVLRSTGTETTVFAGGAYERRTRQGEPVEHVFKVAGGAQIVRRVTAGAPAFQQGASYVLTDHLGSTDVVVDDEGRVLERRYRDPWGHPTNSASYRIAWTTPSSGVREGFGGHEEEAETRLTDMGGRVYDPVTARFLSADPLTAAVGSRQAYNRYSFVRNRPTTYSDPTGFQESLPVREPTGTYVGTIVDHAPDGSTVIVPYDGCRSGYATAGPAQQTSEGVRWRENQGCVAPLSPVGALVPTNLSSGTSNPETGATSRASGAGAGAAEIAESFARGVGEAVTENLVGMGMGLGIAATVAAAATVVTAPAWMTTGAVVGLGGLAVYGIVSIADDVADTAADIHENGLNPENARDLGYVTTNVVIEVVEPEARLGRTAQNGVRNLVSRMRARFEVTPSGVAIPTSADELRAGMAGLKEASTAPETSRKFVARDSQGPVRVRIEVAHPENPKFAGVPDPLHVVDHLHIDRRANVETGPWDSAEKVPYDWPF